MEDGSIVANRIGICPSHHLLLTTNKADLSLQQSLLGPHTYFYNDQFIYDMLDPHPPFYSATLAWAAGKLSEHPKPGEVCRGCDRRVPYPKKESSPKTKVFGVRVPIDDSEEFEQIVETTAHHLGLHNKPHWKYWTLHYALVAALQLPEGETLIS